MGSHRGLWSRIGAVFQKMAMVASADGPGVGGEERCKVMQHQLRDLGADICKKAGPSGYKIIQQGRSDPLPRTQAVPSPPPNLRDPFLWETLLKPLPCGPVLLPIAVRFLGPENPFLFFYKIFIPK